MEPTTDARAALERLIRARDRGVLRPVLDDHGIDLVVAFGSATRADAEPADLDLAIGHAGDLDVIRLLEDLYQLTGYERFDVLDLRRAGTVARGEALGDGQLVVESPPGLFAELQMVAVTMMWDTRWLRDVELAQLAVPGEKRR